MPAELNRTLFEIANRHGLAPWIYRRDESLDDYRIRRYGAPANPTELGRARLERQHAKPIGVPPDANASQASNPDHERFCLWLRQEIASRNHESKWGRITAGFE